MTDISAARRLRTLLDAPGLVTMPGIWDGLTARLAQDAGFTAGFFSGSCVSAARLCAPDLELVSFGEMFASFELVRSAAPDLLILADGDHGYGNALNVQRTVRAYGRSGAAAILIEDKAMPRALGGAGKLCVSRNEARTRMRAAVDAAAESGMLVVGRTDCRPGEGLEEALARIEMFREEGADILFLDAPANEEEIRRFVEIAAGKPTLAVLSPGGPRETPSQARAAELGIKIGLFPTALLLPVVAGAQAGLAALASGESQARVDLSPAELKIVLGQTEYQHQAARYLA